MRAARLQSGWAFVVVLIALAIVALLARDALTRMVDRTVGPTGPAMATSTQTPEPTRASPQAPLARAQGVEGTVQRKVDELGKRIDEGAR